MFTFSAGFLTSHPIISILFVASLFSNAQERERKSEGSERKRGRKKNCFHFHLLLPPPITPTAKVSAFGLASSSLATRFPRSTIKENHEKSLVIKQLRERPFIRRYRNVTETVLVKFYRTTNPLKLSTALYTKYNRLKVKFHAYGTKTCSNSEKQSITGSRLSEFTSRSLRKTPIEILLTINNYYKLWIELSLTDFVLHRLHLSRLQCSLNLLSSLRSSYLGRSSDG